MGKFNKLSIIVITLMVCILISLLTYVYLKKNDDNGNINNSSNNVINNTTNKQNNNKYIVINNYCIKINDSKFSKCIKEEVDNKKFIIYVNNNYVGSYKIKYGTTWNLFDDNNDYVDYDGSLVAVSNNLNVSFISFTEESFTSDMIINANKILNSKNNEVESNMHYNHYYSLDNGANIVITSNLYGQRNNYFNLSYYHNDGVNTIIFKDESNNISKLSTHELDLTFYIDDKFYVVYSLLNESNLSNTFSMYRYEYSKFVKVI